jgi:hypothetical protein
MSFIVYNPTSGASAKEMSLAKRLNSLDNGVLGVIDNGKLNSDTVLKRIAQRLGERYRIKDTVWVKKHSFSHGIRDDEAKQLAEQCDFVIAGVGD